MTTKITHGYNGYIVQWNPTETDCQWYASIEEALEEIRDYLSYSNDEATAETVRLFECGQEVKLKIQTEPTVEVA